MNQQLAEHRKNASDLSLGQSHDKIYRKALEIFSERPLKGRHLDFGSGRGQFLELLLSQHPEVAFTGVDLMQKPKACSNSLAWAQGDLNNNLPFESGVFDSISALEIIEHLENPRQVFRELYRVMVKGGCLLMSTPNNESLRALLSYWKRGHFVAFTDRDYPAHITALNRMDLQRSAQESGFEVVDFKYSGYGCLPGLTRWSWQGLSFGMFNGLRFSDNLFVIFKKN